MIARRQAQSGRVRFSAALLLLCAALGCDESARPGLGRSPEPPSTLVAASFRCPSGSSAFRIEKEGYIRTERYPYDPRDGIRGVTLLLRAGACHRAAGRTREANRAASAAKRLSSRIAQDYSAARVGLERALSNESWGAVTHDAHRLLAFTDHVQPHPYVQWLRRVASRAASHDDTSR
jgi:hypothetical protein